MPRLARIGLPVLFAPLLICAASGAQSRPLVTEAEYLSAFDERHPTVRESAEALARAEAAARAAATLENPTVGAVREDPRGPARQLDLVASWQIPDAARWSGIEARKREVDAARARFEQAVTNHRLTMRAAYAGWAVASSRRDLLESQAARFEALARRETARAEKGEVSRLGAHRLGLAAGVLRSRVALAAAEADRARAEASTWVSDLPAMAVPTLPNLVELSVLRGQHSRVRAAEAELAAAELDREAAGRYLRSPEVSLGWQRQEIGPDSVDGPIFGLAWSIPIFDRKRSARESGDARIEAARARLEIARREVSAERKAAESSYSQLREALAKAREGLAASSRMLTGAEAAFRLGESTLTDLLETHRSVIEAELAAIDLHEAALGASRDLERLAGSGEVQTDLSSDASNSSSTRKDTP